MDEKKNLPTHTLYLVSDGPDDKSWWRPIGGAWPHKDGKGWGITLDGDLVIRERKEKKEQEPIDVIDETNPF